MCSIRPGASWISTYQWRNINCWDKYGWDGNEKSTNYQPPLRKCRMEYYRRFCLGTEKYWTLKWKHGLFSTVMPWPVAFESQRLLSPDTFHRTLTWLAAGCRLTPTMDNLWHIMVVMTWATFINVARCDGFGRRQRPCPLLYLGYTERERDVKCTAWP